MNAPNRALSRHAAGYVAQFRSYVRVHQRHRQLLSVSRPWDVVRRCVPRRAVPPT